MPTRPDLSPSTGANRAAAPIRDPQDPNVRPISAAAALDRLGEFDAIIDTRSESEYALDHLPGAINWPSLRDAERALVGTLYKRVNPFEARKRGAALVAHNVARFIEECLGGKARTWRPLLYCWRGGQRSASFAHVLGQIGFKVHLIEGGYKAFRNALRADLPLQAERLRYRVLCGPTGSGKTRLLGALERAGAQVLDLEALASHRASVLGSIPGQPQPTQKYFETLLWETLRKFDRERPVFTEAESRKVGDVMLPEALVQAMRSSPCLLLDLPRSERVALLMEDYPFFVHEPEVFCERLDALIGLRGHVLVNHWQELARSGRIEIAVRELLEKHYDPGYTNSTRRNFVHFAEALPVGLTDRSLASMAQAAGAILGEAESSASTRDSAPSSHAAAARETTSSAKPRVSSNTTATITSVLNVNTRAK